MPLAHLLTISLVVAIASAVPIPFLDLALPPESPMEVHLRTFTPAVVWLMLLVAALVVHGKRGLWLLVGAPFALFWPVVWTEIFFVNVRSFKKVESEAVLGLASKMLGRSESGTRWSAHPCPLGPR